MRVTESQNHFVVTLSACALALGSCGDGKIGGRDRGDPDGGDGTPRCGDGQCNDGETCSTCARDCTCAPVCPNQSCEVGETCDACPQDCGTCPGDDGILPDDRVVDWTQVGIPGGIPERTEICARVTDAPYSAAGDGVTDDTAAIQDALDDCPAEQVVLIPAGIYRVTDVLRLNKPQTLRGEGPGVSVIDAFGTDWGGAITLGPEIGGDGGTAANILAGATKGSTQITLDSVAAVHVGGFLQIDELNHAGLVESQGYNSNCNWCSRADGTRALGQIVEVAGVDAGSATVTFAPPLYWTYSHSPQALAFDMGNSRAGVEDLTVRCNDTGYRANFTLYGCAYCWLANVEGDYTDGDQVDVLSSFRCEIRDSYFHDAFHHVPGQTDNDIFLAQKTSATLVENNIIYRLHVGVMLNWGAAGNVVAYNYFASMFDERVPHCAYPAMAMHGAHPLMNLFEGNIGTRFNSDSYWGSSSHTTLFRNWLSGVDEVCEPVAGPRAPVDPGDCFTPFQQPWAVSAEYQSLNTHLVGNVLGSVYFTTTHLGTYYGTTDTETTPVGEYLLVPPAASGYTTPYALRFGYPGCCGPSEFESTAAFDTSLIHGNWDWVDQGVRWDPAIAEHAIPASLYLAGKPSWFGDRDWPPIDPLDSPTTLEPTAIPAGYRFVHGTPPPGAD